jgi:mannose-6-phosphate isomerase-like protein (cupin superfamily)
MALTPIRRIVTGHDAHGKAIVSEVGPLSKVVAIDRIPGTVFHEVWSTAQSPVRIDNGEDPTQGDLRLPPPKNGTRIRFVDIPPDTAEFLAHGAQRMQDAFAQVGDATASTVRADSPHPVMHRTETVDYGIVIDGEITLVLDDSEIPLHKGDVVIQRGTNHSWANRSSEPCRMLFMLVDGDYDPAIRAALAKSRR